MRQTFAHEEIDAHGPPYVGIAQAIFGTGIHLNGETEGRFAEGLLRLNVCVSSSPRFIC